jgi:oligopeptide transport system substrate-binding protein
VSRISNWPKSTTAIILATATFLLIACSCGPQPSDSVSPTATPTATGGELTLLRAAPSTLDPAVCGDSTSASYIVEIFSGLVTLDNDLNVVGDIAEDWEVSADGKTYTFHLRQGVKFHDGRALTAGDFKYSIERAADPATGSPVAEAYLGDIVGVKEKLAGEADEVSGVRVIDDGTLEITIDAPKAYFLAKLVHCTAYVVDSDNVESGDDWWRHPNGIGPFSLAEWLEGDRIVLERNDYYYRGVAKLDSVTFLLRGDSMMMYENDQIHITGVGSASIERVLDPTNPLNEQLVVAPELSILYIGFNNEIPPFDDAAVRRAFCHAVDKDKLIEILLKDTVFPADGILPPGMPGHNESLQGLDYDVTYSQQLIDESAYSDGLPPVVLSVSGDCTGVSALYSAIAWMWQENLGAQVEIQSTEFDTLLYDLRGYELQTFTIGWIADYPDPENFLDLLFHSGSVENHTRYSEADVDALLEAARVESDTEARLAIYGEIEQAIVNDAPCLPIYFDQDYYLVKPEVKGFHPSPLVSPIFKDVWIDK